MLAKQALLVPTKSQYWPVIAVFGSLALVVSAKLQVPFYPVPLTMQTAVVFLLGLAFGPRIAVAAVLAYLAQGAVGLPVFAGTPEKGIGLAYMLGPTGGYLAGFVVAAWICGHAAAAGWRGWRIAGAVLLSTLAIYALGVGWLTTLIGFDKAIAFGLLPFIYGDLLKWALVVAVAELGLSRLAANLREA